MMDIISEITWQIEEEDFNRAQIKIAKDFCTQRDKFYSENRTAMEEFFLIPIGLKINSLRPKVMVRTMSVFETFDDYTLNLIEEGFEIKDALDQIFKYVNETHTFIHIPSDLDFQEYTKIEGRTVQALMGTTVEEMIKTYFTQEFISDINANLDGFIEEISQKLGKYEYRKPSKKQILFNSSHLSANSTPKCTTR